jgi:pyruvate/2-oxoglutarate dehydrogenase complex dihydrolipoamide dehydrogenase (E3) component
MPPNAFDLIAIGGGTAGLITASGSAGLGASVGLIERHRMGGECLWNGCVPSKALIAAARAAHSIRSAERFGVTAGAPIVDMDRVREWVRGVQDTIAPNDSPERYRGLGVHVVEGEARLVDARTVEVNGTQLRARRIVLATGTRPAVPPIPGLADVNFLTNESVFDLNALPPRLLVIGGGPIGAELAQAFARLGSTVQVIEALPTFFAREDPDIAAVIHERLLAEGIAIHLGTKATAVRQDVTGITVSVTGADGVSRELVGDALLVAVGRTPNIERLGLDAVGVRTDRGGIVVDKTLQTTVPGIYAAGDIVSGAPKFTHAADYMSRTVIRNALFPGSSATDYSAIPWVTYTEPEVAHIGLTEAEARSRYGNTIGVWSRPFAHVDRAIADGDTHGLVKIITAANGRVIGGHIVGPHAGEMIGELTIAVKLKLTVGQLGGVIHPYPTTAEAIRQAAEQRVKAGFTGWKKALVRRLVRRV